MSKIYQVTILPFSVNTTEQNGFIDDLRIEERTTDLSSVNYSQCQAKWRGMERWQQIIEAISLVANPTIITSLATGATASTDATNFTFTMKVDRENTLYLVRNGTVMVDDVALKQMIAESLSVSQTKICGIIDPNLANGYIIRTENLTIGALGDLPTALSKISITVTQS